MLMRIYRATPLALLIGGFAALLPRLVVANLENEGIALSEGWRVGLLVVSSVGLAVAVCGGGALSGRLAITATSRRRTMMAIWVVILAGLAVLVAGRMIADNYGVPLHEVMTVDFFVEHPLYALYHFIAILLAEVSMVAGLSAFAIQAQDERSRSVLQEKLQAALQEATDLRAELVHLEQAAQQDEAERGALKADLQALRVSSGSGRSTVRERVWKCLEAAPGGLSASDLAKTLAVSDGTIRNALKGLVDDGLVVQARPPADAATQAGWWFYVEEKAP